MRIGQAVYTIVYLRRLSMGGMIPYAKPVDTLSFAPWHHLIMGITFLYGTERSMDNVLLIDAM